jgi:hypothetical protein
MTTHAEFPRLCRDCELEAQSLAESFTSDSHVLQVCRDNRVVAVGLQRNGKIRSWHMEGPGLTDAEIDALTARLLATFAQSGMKFHHRDRAKMQ